MTLDRYLRMIAGSFVLVSLTLGYWGEPLLVSLHSFRRAELVPISLYELVSYDDNPPQSRREGIG
jgi:hypothetical protein